MSDLVPPEFTLTNLAKALLYGPHPSGPKDGHSPFTERGHWRCDNRVLGPGMNHKSHWSAPYFDSEHELISWAHGGQGGESPARILEGQVQLALGVHMEGAGSVHPRDLQLGSAEAGASGGLLWAAWMRQLRPSPVPAYCKRIAPKREGSGQFLARSRCTGTGQGVLVLLLRLLVLNELLGHAPSEGHLTLKVGHSSSHGILSLPGCILTP